MKSIFLKAIAFFGCTTFAPARPDAARDSGFELGVVARDPNSMLTREVDGLGSGKTRANERAILTTADIQSAKSLTQGAWYVLSGRHYTTTLVITVKPEAVARVQSDLQLAASRDDRLAVMLDGKLLAVVIAQHALDGREFSIDASFLSSGTERSKERECKEMARRINATLR